MVASGRTTQEVAAAQVQLGQALGKGKLDGDEFRSLMENMTPLMHIFARELGVSFGELKSLAPQGKITAEIMFAALLENTELINKQFGNVKVTAGQAFGQMTTSAVQFFSALEERMGALQAFSKFISDLALGWKALNQNVEAGLYGKKVSDDYNRAAENLLEAQEKLAKDPGNKKLASDVDRYTAQVKSILNSIDLRRLNMDISYTGSLIADVVEDLDEMPDKGTDAYTARMTGKQNPLGISVDQLQRDRKRLQKEQVALGDLWLKAQAAQEKSQKDSNKKKEEYEIEYNTSSTAAAKDWLSKKKGLFEAYENDRLIFVQRGLAKQAAIQKNFDEEELGRQGRVREVARLKIQASYDEQRESLLELQAAGADVSAQLAALDARRAAQMDRLAALPEIDPEVALRNYFGFSGKDVSNYMSRLQEAEEFQQFGQHENDPAATFEAEMAAEEERHQLVMEALRRQLEEKFITQKEYNDRLAAENALNADKQTQISMNQMDAEMNYHHAKLSAMSAVLNASANLFGAFSKKSKGLAIASFLFSKAAAAADVIVSTQVAIMRAFKDFGPIKGAPLAAAMAVAGKLSLLAIAASTIGGVSNIGGGGGRVSPPTPSGGGGGDSGRTALPLAVSGREEDKNITIKIDTQGGVLFTAEQVRMLAKDLVENYGDAINVRAEVI